MSYIVGRPGGPSSGYLRILLALVLELIPTVVRYDFICRNAKKIGSTTCRKRLAAWVGIFRCRKSDKEVIIVFHDYSIIIARVKYALFWPHFRPFSAVIMLVLCQCQLYLSYPFPLNTPFFSVRKCVYNRGGLNPGYKSL